MMPVFNQGGIIHQKISRRWPQHALSGCMTGHAGFCGKVFKGITHGDFGIGYAGFRVRDYLH